MAKYNVGDEVAIAAIMKISVIQPQRDGSVSYSTDRGITIREALVEQIALAPKSQAAEEPKPEPKPAHRFKVGDRVANANPELGFGTINEIGRTLGIETYFIKADDGQHWICTSDAISPAPEPPKFYTGKVVCVGIKNTYSGYKLGMVIEIDNGVVVSPEDFECNGRYIPYSSFEHFSSQRNHGLWCEVKSDVH